MLVPDGSESTLRQPISSVGHRHREDRPDTWSPSVPRQPPIVFTMPPHTTPLLILTHGDAMDPIPSAVQQTGTTAAAADIHGPGEFLTDVDADVIWLGPNYFAPK